MIEFIEVRKEYADHTALDGISFTVRDGEFVFIVGKSGAGKTTLTKTLLREENADSGQIIINGTDITKLRDAEIPYYRRTLGMVFQDFRLFPDKTAAENVAFAMRVVGTPAAEIRERVPKLLQLVGIAEKAGHYPREMSGGEQQRVALARALANQPEIIIADEPTGNVDPQMSLIIMNMLLEINRRVGTTVLVVTHAKELVDQMAQRTITIEDGHVLSDIPASAVTEEEGFDGK